jgi:hypothetical protein
MFRFLIVASFVAAATGQAVAPPGGCLVCGDGNVITAPDAIFRFPSQPTVPCDILQLAGLTGEIPLETCPFLPSLIGVCECMEGNLPAAPTDAPVPAPTDAPTPAPVPPPTPAPVGGGGGSTACPDVPSSGCSVCGTGECVTIPEAIFTFSGQPEVPCGVLQQAGYMGQVPGDQCPFLPGLVADICGCDSTVPGAPPTPAPVEPPTSAPVPVATPAPVTVVTVVFTPAPVVIFTSAPVDVNAPTDKPESGGMGMGSMGMSSDGDDDDEESGKVMGMGMGMMRRELHTTEGTIRGI